MTVFRIIDAVVLVYFLVGGAFLLVLQASASRAVANRDRVRVPLVGLDPQGSSLSLRVSALIPAHNEGPVVVETVRAMLTQEYPSLEVVVVNDGSSDDTFEQLRRAFMLEPTLRAAEHGLGVDDIIDVYSSDRFPNLTVANRYQGGKAAALNTGVALATGELVCAIDADTIVDPRAIALLVQPFLDDDRVVAAGGTVRIANGCTIEAGRVVTDRAPRRVLPAIQEVEYIRAFALGRLGWNRLGGNIIISGAFGLFRRDALQAAGGYAHDNIGEDMELVLRIRRTNRELGLADRVQFLTEPVAWTLAPESLRVLGRQRNRWQRGLLDTLWAQRAVIGRRRYGLLGTFITPYYLVFEALAPALEVLGLASIVAAIALGAVDWAFVALFVLAAYGLSLVAGLWAIALDTWIDPGRRSRRDWMQRVACLLLEQVGYRQATVWWRMRGIVAWFRGDRRWGENPRDAFSAPPVPVPVATRVSDADRHNGVPSSPQPVSQ